jgi:hypothetical protein
MLRWREDRRALDPLVLSSSKMNLSENWDMWGLTSKADSEVVLFSSLVVRGFPIVDNLHKVIFINYRAFQVHYLAS